MLKFQKIPKKLIYGRMLRKRTRRKLSFSSYFSKISFECSCGAKNNFSVKIESPSAAKAFAEQSKRTGIYKNRLPNRELLRSKLKNDFPDSPRGRRPLRRKDIYGSIRNVCRVHENRAVSLSSTSLARGNRLLLRNYQHDRPFFRLPLSSRAFDTYGRVVTCLDTTKPALILRRRPRRPSFSALCEPSACTRTWPPSDYRPFCESDVVSGAPASRPSASLSPAPDPELPTPGSLASSLSSSTHTFPFKESYVVAGSPASCPRTTFVCSDKFRAVESSFFYFSI